jgi:PleD family two-component response regulator
MSLPFVKEAGNAPFSKQVEQASFLIVDDFDSMRRITANQLRQLGAKRISEAANGAEALRLLKSERITVILSDWNMPVMSGLELLQAVRSTPELSGLPFIMITAEAERDRVEQAIQSGVSELLVKPYTAARFAERLERAMGRKVRTPPQGGVHATPAFVPATTTSEPATVPAAASLTGAPAEKPTILVVDDTPDNLHLLSQLFKDEYRVKIAHNGEKALSIAQTDTPPDLILLDIMMPGLDGFEVATQLRAHPSSEHIPIIFVTAMTDDAARLKGLELGAVDFVTKPIQPEILQVRVRNFMRYIDLHRHLQADYDTMLEAARLKEDVEHIMRHDLKGPLAGIVGLTQNLIETSALRTEQCEQLRMIEDAAMQVLNMINLSAEIYKIETGRFVLHPQPVPVIPILNRLTTIMSTVFAVKELDITLRKPADRSAEALQASGDPMFCHSLLQNLIKNACEAAPAHSQITLAVTMDDAVTISIENSGTVPHAVRERFFEKFATAGKNGGTGLGTYSAKLLTEAQHGSIAMETSDEKNQTRIVITLPKN